MDSESAPQCVMGRAASPFVVCHTCSTLSLSCSAQSNCATVLSSVISWPAQDVYICFWEMQPFNSGGPRQSRLCWRRALPAWYSQRLCGRAPDWRGYRQLAGQGHPVSAFCCSSAWWRDFESQGLLRRPTHPPRIANEGVSAADDLTASARRRPRSLVLILES